MVTNVSLHSSPPIKLYFCALNSCGCLTDTCTILSIVRTQISRSFYFYSSLYSFTLFLYRYQPPYIKFNGFPNKGGNASISSPSSEESKGADAKAVEMGTILVFVFTNTHNFSTFLPAHQFLSLDLSSPSICESTQYRIPVLSPLLRFEKECEIPNVGVEKGVN